MNIPFNKPHITGKEVHYIYDAVASGHISGNGKYTKMCQRYFEERWGFRKVLLTTSCTDALEMCAMLLEIRPGDEVIIPSFTFVSTALAFYREGAKIVFADSRSDHPGIDEEKIEELITSRTKVIVVVHYAGVACDMEKVIAIADRHGLFVVEDAAQAIDSYYTGSNGVIRSLGSIGHLAAFSFHETKNIQCGEGGMLAINDERFVKRAEIIWEKGTNRAEFFRGEVNKYGWVDTGSSFLPSEVSAAFLWAQIEEIDSIQKRRKEIWEWYDHNVRDIFSSYSFDKPIIPLYATNNAHMYYLVCSYPDERTRLIEYLKSKGFIAVFHYQSLHKSLFYRTLDNGRSLPLSERYSDCLVRLPLYFGLDPKILKSLL
jgi:dTDP-4-amino-4,6-dideoxygalactose transaminase